MEPRRAWWRRDVIVMALDAAYPHWLTSPQLLALCAEIEPDFPKTSMNHPDAYLSRSLGRLHTYRQVDRIGKPGKARPGAMDCKTGTGYRYRIRRS